MKTLGGLVAVMLLVGVVGLVAAVNSNGWAGAEGSAQADGRANANVPGVFDAHIATAQRLQAAGAVNASSANAFVAAANDLKAQFNAASDARSRAELVVKLNAKWRAFVQEAHVTAEQEVNASAQANASVRKDLREKLKETREDLREELQERREGLREKANELRDEAREKAKELREELREERQNVLAMVRAKVATLESRLKELRAKAELTAEEKVEFKAKVLNHIDASFDERISAAMRLEAEGVNHTLVANFVAFATAQKAKFANATNNTVRKELVVEFNAQWRAFKQAAEVELKAIRLKEILNKSDVALDRINELIAKLQARGYNVTALQNASATIAVRLDAAANATTFQQGVTQLQAAHRGLVYLKQAIQLTLRREKVEAFIDRLDQRIEQKLNASVAVATQTTVGVGGIFGSAVSISAGSSNAPSPSPSASASPSAQASASVSAAAGASASGSGASGSASGGANAGGTASTGATATGSLNSGGSASTSTGVSASSNGNGNGSGSLNVGVGG